MSGSGSSAISGSSSTGTHSNGAAIGSLVVTLPASVVASVPEFASPPALTNSRFASKHVGPPGYEPFVLNVGGAGSSGLFDWVDATLAGTAVGKDFAVAECSADGKQLSERSGTGGLLTEIGFPALDAADKGAAELSLKITPEALRRNGGSGARCNAGLGARQKAWGANAFRVELDGIDTKSVSSVSAFTVKQELAVDEIGIVREPTKHAAKVTVPNITFKVSRASSADFEAWAEDFLLNGDDKEKSGAIVLLDQSLKGELARVSLNHVGIAGLSPSADGAYFMATVYVESMRFSVGGAKVKEVKSAAVSKVAGESKLAPASAKVVPAAAVEKKAKKT